MQSNGAADLTQSLPQKQQQHPQPLPPLQHVASAGPPPPPQWVAAMQYPAASMVMQHQMMVAAAAAAAQGQYASPPPHYLQYQQQQGVQYQQGHGGGGSDENRTIWVGDLQYWMDENYLHGCFAHTGEVASIKVIRNKQTAQSEGYGFIEFYSHATAEKVLQSFNGMGMPNADTVFRLNWASFSMGDKRSDNASDLSIFVGDLANDVTDILLLETFSNKYSSVRGAKVVIDTVTGHSKGYGFVRFGDENEKTRAMTEMNGAYCSSRPMRIGAATPRKSNGNYPSNGANGFQGDMDSSNTTVFVGGLDPNASEDDLRVAFSQYGDITSIKIPVGKQCGFIQFVHRSHAEEALQGLNGTVIGKQTVRLSWGRHPANKQRADQSGHWNNSYYGGQIYDGSYGYAPPHDPSAYASAYGVYPMYGSQQVS